MTMGYLKWEMGSRWPRQWVEWYERWWWFPPFPYGRRERIAMTKAFRVEYKCGNCGKEWSEEYEAGIFILPYPPSDTAEDDGPIRCPNCNYYRQRILARGPIEEE